MGSGDRLKSSYSSYNDSFHEQPIFHYLQFLMVIAILVFVVLLYNNASPSTSSQQSIDVNDFLSKLTANEGMGAYVGVAPLNIVQVNSDNIANLQTQIAGLDASFLGSFIVQYTDAIVIYDYNNNLVLGTVSLQPQQPQLPADFSAKLNAHSELAGLEAEQPTGGQLDRASLDTLIQQFPEVYADAKVGDFLLRYSTRLIIYDYNTDVIVNAVALG
jgi:hypothetical protein